MAKNFLLNESIDREMSCSLDGAYRRSAPKVPVQPIFSYRFLAGSDTGPAPQKNQRFVKMPGATTGNPKVDQHGVEFYATGGTIKPNITDKKLSK